MTLMSAVRSFFTPPAPVRERRATGSMWVATGEQDAPLWGQDDYLAFAENGYGRNELVFACIKQIVGAATQSRLRVMVPDEDNDESEDATSPLADLLRTPTGMQPMVAFAELYHTSMQIAGNAYALKVRGGYGAPQELRIMRPDRMRVVPGADGNPKGYVYRIAAEDYPIRAEDVIHWKSANLANDWYGLSPLHVLSNRVNLDMDMTIYQRAFFRKGGIPGGILKLSRQVDDDEPDILRRQWRQQFSGSEAWNIAVFGDDLAYQQVAIDLDKMMMPDLSSITEARICMAYCVPPILVGAKVGLDRATYSNYEQAFTAFWYSTVVQENRRFADGLTQGLAAEFPGEWRLDMDVSDVRALQEDEDKRATRWVSLYHGGLAMQNEGRAGVDLDPVDGGDVFLIPTGFTQITLDDLGSGNYPLDPAAQWRDGEMTLNEVRATHGLPPLPGGDVRRVDARVVEQSLAELEAGVEPSRPPVINVAEQGPPYVEPDALAPNPPALPPAPSVDVTVPPGPSTAQNRRYRPAIATRARTPRQAKYAATLAAQRQAHTQTATADLEAYFRHVARVAMSRWGNLRQAVLEGRAMPGPDDLIPPGADAQLAKLLARLYAQVTRDTWEATNESGLVGDVPFDERSPNVTQILQQAQSRAVGINQTTRDQLAKTLSTGVERGYSMQQIAHGVPTEGYPGVRSVITETYANRAMTVARTEVMRAQLGAQVARYAASDVSEVEMQDGTDFDEECADRDGQVVSLDEAETEMDAEHPNGTLSFMPVLDLGEGEA